MKLEDLPKKEIFSVPEGYFEKLPGIIQARVAEQQRQPESRPVLKYTFQYALPVVALIMVGIFWFNNRAGQATTESMLAEIQTEDLIAYLDDTEMSTDELLDHASLDASDVDEIENEVYGFDLDDETLDIITDEIDLNNL
ncbi:hypothetical protein [Ohtaekwangia koreensis]|uniref:Uncharacterized protein n=1 Tax=Ohtaekwangia koreensis TaxID=688867 RepID=A0A1T5MBK9_9BACT|nr:hypothetical protein [Ohtaekwangia koreensis]SKC85600.1 hypothetical protein SAMN05660236_4922 [Ohtaekwangia koreensis]